MQPKAGCAPLFFGAAFLRNPAGWGRKAGKRKGRKDQSGQPQKAGGTQNEGAAQGLRGRSPSERAAENTQHNAGMANGRDQRPKRARQAKLKHAAFFSGENGWGGGGIARAEGSRLAVHNFASRRGVKGTSACHGVWQVGGDLRPRRGSFWASARGGRSYAGEKGACGLVWRGKRAGWGRRAAR